MMKKNLSLILMLVFVLPGSLSAKQIPHESVPAAPVVSSISIEQSRVEIKELIASKKYLQAQKQLEELLASPGLTKEMSKKINDNYLKLNRKILFSKYETPDSIRHEVAAGDSLYKIAKKYKVTPGLIKRVNGLKKDTVFLGSKLKIPQGVFTTHVDVSKNHLILYFNGKPIEEYQVCTGKTDSPTPIGTFKITDKLEKPTWYKTGAVVAPGDPENGLGTRWLGFDKKGYGIHGTNEPESIGKHASSGCVRMLNKNVEELYALVPSGSEVTIVS